MTKVLIIDRKWNPTVWVDNIHLADSSGNRNVWFYSSLPKTFK